MNARHENVANLNHNEDDIVDINESQENIQSGQAVPAKNDDEIKAILVKRVDTLLLEHEQQRKDFDAKVEVTEEDIKECQKDLKQFSIFEDAYNSNLISHMYKVENLEYLLGYARTLTESLGQDIPSARDAVEKFFAARKEPWYTHLFDHVWLKKMNKLEERMKSEQKDIEQLKNEIMEIIQKLSNDLGILQQSWGKLQEDEAKIHSWMNKILRRFQNNQKKLDIFKVERDRLDENQEKARSKLFERMKACMNGFCSLEGSDREHGYKNNAGAPEGRMVAGIRPTMLDEQSAHALEESEKVEGFVKQIDGVSSSASRRPNLWAPLTYVFSAITQGYHLVQYSLNDISFTSSQSDIAQESFSISDHLVSATNTLFGIPQTTFAEHAAIINAHSGENLTSEQQLVQHINHTSSASAKFIVGQYVVHYALKNSPFTLPWNKQHTLSDSQKVNLKSYQKQIQNFEKMIASQKISRTGQSGLFDDNFSFVDKTLAELKQSILKSLKSNQITNAIFSDIQNKINRIEETIHKLAKLNKILRRFEIKEDRLDRRNQRIGCQSTAITHHSSTSDKLTQEIIKTLPHTNETAEFDVVATPASQRLLPFSTTQQFWKLLDQGISEPIKTTTEHYETRQLRS